MFKYAKQQLLLICNFQIKVMDKATGLNNTTTNYYEDELNKSCVSAWMKVWK